MQDTTLTDWRELAHRMGDDLEVTLLWSKSTNRVRVSVRDERLGQHFELDVPGADALNGFHHPFAHTTDQPSARQLGGDPIYL